MIVKLREGATNTRYGYLMLIKYARDLKELYQRGWKLPKDEEIKDLDWLEKWATENGKINPSKSK